MQLYDFTIPVATTREDLLGHQTFLRKMIEFHNEKALTAFAGDQFNQVAHHDEFCAAYALLLMRCNAALAVMHSLNLYDVKLDLNLEAFDVENTCS